MSLGEGRMLSKQETENRYWNPKWDNLLSPQQNLLKIINMYKDYVCVKTAGVGSELYKKDQLLLDMGIHQTYQASLESECFLPKMCEIYDIVKKHVLDDK